MYPQKNPSRASAGPARPTPQLASGTAEDVRHVRPQSPCYGPASGPRRSGGDVDE